MKLMVLGTGCAKCNALAGAVERVADQLGLEYELEHVTDLAKIASYGVMMTPALVVDGAVKIAGKLPSDADLTAVLSAAAE